MNEIEQALLDAYASIGRQGTGTATNQIDPQGYAYWTNRAAQENLSPEQLKTMFNAEVGNYFQQKPTDPYTNYVADYLVRDAYSNIGRTGLGDQVSNIDPEGYNFWVNKTINEGLTPDQLSRQFGAEVTQRLANSNVQTQPAVERYVSNYIQNKSAPFVTLSAQPTGLRNLGIFGAASNEMIGAGNAPYQSELIKSLRQSNQQRLSNNPGVTMFETFGNNTTPVQFTRPTGQLAFNPPRLSNQNTSLSSTDTTGNVSTANNNVVSPPGVNSATNSNANNTIVNNNIGVNDVGSDQNGGQNNTGVIGQGINNDFADLGLALMAYGEAGKGLLPGSLASEIIGNAITGQQLNAMGRAADALTSTNEPGVISVADKHGNVFGYSSPATIAASDAATFGTSLSALEAAVAEAMSGYAEGGTGYGGDISGDGLGW